MLLLNEFSLNENALRIHRPKDQTMKTLNQLLQISDKLLPAVE